MSDSTASAAVPTARRPGSYTVAMVCLGNICRSPIAAAVLRSKLADAGLDAVEVISSGTGDWHIGGPMDRRAAAVLRSAGYDDTHRAQQITPDWLSDVDLLLAMDRANYRDISALGEIEPGRLRMLRDFDPEDVGAEIPDPYFGGPDGFRDVLEAVERSCTTLVTALVTGLGQAP